MGPKLLLSLRLWAAAMLAVIGLQAIPTTALPTHVTHGSAFNASTQEQSLGARRAEAGEVQVAPQPQPLPQLPVLPIERLRDSAEDAAPWPANRQTGPPARPIPLYGGATPRAPPVLN